MYKRNADSCSRKKKTYSYNGLFEMKNRNYQLKLGNLMLGGEIAYTLVYLYYGEMVILLTSHRI